MEQQGRTKRKLLIEDDEDILAVATGANTLDLQYLPLPNSGGWYAHFDHREGSIELGRSTMLATPTVGSDVLIIPAQWQQRPRSGGPCDATLTGSGLGTRYGRHPPGGGAPKRDSKRNRVSRWFATRPTPYRYDPLDNLQQFTIHSASA